MPVYVRDGSIIPTPTLDSEHRRNSQRPARASRLSRPAVQRLHLSRRRPHLPLPERRVPAPDASPANPTTRRFVVTFHAREGSYVPWWKFFEVVIYDWPSAHAEAKFSSSTYPLKTTYDAKQHALHMTLADVSAEAELTVRGRSSSLISGTGPYFAMRPQGPAAETWAPVPVKIKSACCFPSSANSSRT